MLKVRHRQRLRRKEATTLVEQLRGILGVEIAGPDEPVETADAEGWQLIIVGGKALGFIHDSRPFLTVRGLLALKPEHLFVTVDMGAVKFVCNGADVMSPGVVDADRTIRAGELIWVRDEKNLKPLAVAEALISGEEMIASESGKAAKSLHYVGDKLWKMEE